MQEKNGLRNNLTGEFPNTPHTILTYPHWIGFYMGDGEGRDQIEQGRS